MDPLFLKTGSTSFRYGPLIGVRRDMLNAAVPVALLEASMGALKPRV